MKTTPAPKKTSNKANNNARFILIIALLLGAWAWFSSDKTKLLDATQGSTALRVLAGSELKDIEPLLPRLQKDTGVQLRLEYVGTLEGAERIAQGADVPLAWFSHAKYLELLEPARSRIQAREKIALSPVILGIKQSTAQKLGWDKTPPSWSDLAREAGAGRFNFAMTNPTASNTGFSALIALIAALSNDPEAFTLTAPQQAKVQDFFRGQKLTAGSSGWLVEAYLREQDRLDGLINYESVLLQMNQNGGLREPLTLIYPSDGVITADYPLLLLDANKRADYDKVVAWLKSPAIQSELMQTTDRRPILPNIPLDARFGHHPLIELPFPGQRSVVDRILGEYLDQQRPPAHAYFVIDLSGSMQGERIAALQQALFNLMGDDTSLSGEFARFRQREHITFVPFRQFVEPPLDITILNTADINRARQFAQGIRPEGGTAIFSALQQAYADIARAQAAQPDHYYSVVLMTDGANTAGIDFEQFADSFHRLPAATQAVKTFPIIFGDSDLAAMQHIASLTGGKVFDGNKNLSAAFKTIRGYQ